MNSFGLGLVLNFTDNATSGINNATRAFQQMSQTADAVSSSVSTSITDIVSASYALDAVGTTLKNTGSSILSVFGAVSQKVIDTGLQMQGYRRQLSKLYDSPELGEEKIQEVMQYAKRTNFDVQNLVPAITMMKTVGIEAMDEITTTSGKYTQSLLGYASDFAMMGGDNLHNIYGSGINAAMGALKEYVAEGNTRTLRGAGWNITELLGEEKGTSIEDRMRQVADLAEVLNIAGYAATSAGTPMQRLSNIQDVLYISMSKIADSGVLEVYVNLVEKLSDWVMSLSENEDTFNTITGVLADTVTSVLSPLESLLDILIENGEAIINWVKENPELTKNILLTVAAVGAFLVVGGSFLKLISSIGMASAGFKFLKSLPSLLGVVGSSFTKAVFKATPFLALAGLLYYAWTENLFGIRDTVKQVFKEITDVWTLTADAFSDNTLSYENFQLAKDLGILPFIEAILDLKYLFGELTAGIKTGFDSVFTTIEKLTGKIAPVEGKVYSITGKIGEFLKSIFNVPEDADVWSKVGEVIGVVAGALTVAVPLIMGAFKAFKLVSGVVALVSNPVGQVVLVILAVVAAVVALKKAWDSNLGGIQEKTKAVFQGILGFYQAYIEPLVGRIVKFVGTIITIVVNLWNSWLKPIIMQIGGFISSIWTNSLLPLIQNIASFVGSVVRFVWMIVNAVLDLWNVVLAPIVNWLVTVLAPIINSVVQVILGYIEFVFITVSDIIGGILQALGGVLDFITGVFTGNWSLAWQGICDIFGGIWNTILGVVKGVVNGVIVVINTLISAIYGVVAAVVNGIGSIVSGIGNALGMDIGFSIPETAPQIPFLAEGAKVTSATTAVIGEGKDDEAVLPLNNAVFSEIARGINNNQPVQSQAPIQNDYSVTFAAGSVVIQLANATEAELEKAADKLMKIIERKQQLKKMAVRA